MLNSDCNILKKKEPHLRSHCENVCWYHSDFKHSVHLLVYFWEHPLWSSYVRWLCVKIMVLSAKNRYMTSARHLGKFKQPDSMASLAVEDVHWSSRAIFQLYASRWYFSTLFNLQTTLAQRNTPRLVVITTKERHLRELWEIYCSKIEKKGKRSVVRRSTGNTGKLIYLSEYH